MSELGDERFPQVPPRHLTRPEPQDKALVSWQPQQKAYCGPCKRRFRDTVTLLQHISHSNKYGFSQGCACLPQHLLAQTDFLMCRHLADPDRGNAAEKLAAYKEWREQGSSFCPKCQMVFHTPRALLEHLRDHQTHKVRLRALASSLQLEPARKRSKLSRTGWDLCHCHVQ